jgi:hypothetical protein
MPAPSFLAGLPKPILFGFYGAVGGLLGAVVLGEPAWWLLKPPEAIRTPELAIGASSSVKIYPGTKNTFVIRIAREERFNSPVVIRFENVPPGISLPSVTISSGETQIDATVTADTSVPTGTNKVTFTASAEGGGPTASGSIDVEVIAPPPALALAVPSKLAVYANGTGKFTAQVARRGYDGVISVAVGPLPAGVSAARAVIPSGSNEVEVTLSAAPTTPIETTKLTVTATADTTKLKADAPTQLEVRTPSTAIAPVDVVFVLDVTASMQWALNDLKNGIGTFADTLSRSQIDFRLGLVTFQDITIPGEKIEVVQFDGSPFTANPTIFRDKVGLLKAEGGGDIPESSLEGMHEAVKMPFRQGATKMLLLITDAPPKVARGGKTMEDIVTEVKTQGIDSVHLVVERFDIDTYRPLLSAGIGKSGGTYFKLADVVLGETGFAELLDKLGKVVVEAARARSPDIKPQVAAAPDPPKVPGGIEALKSAEAPPQPTVKGVQASGQFAAGTEGRLTLATGVWAGAITAMLCLTLLSGQYHYLRGRFPSIIRAFVGFVGGLLVGIIGGAAGQGLYTIAHQATVFRILGWALLGGLAGTGLSLFIPNLKWFYGLLGGAIGGAVGGLGYIVVTSVAGDIVGRLVGGLSVGFCIGLMVAIVEAAFRRAWLEVRFGARETISVNLGPEPVKVGGDAKLCTVWARGAAPLALRFFIRDGQVICDDAVMKRESSAADGFVKEVGNVTVTVRTGSGVALTQGSPATYATRTASPGSLATPATNPPAKATSGAATKVPTMDDDFDLLPMAKSPPPAAARPVAPAVTVSESRSTSPSVPDSPPPSTAPKPPTPAPPPPSSKPAPPKPPASPVPSTARPTAPATPKTASSPPASSPPTSPPKNPDACPGCGRMNPGKPKSRYCMVCDRTY